MIKSTLITVFVFVITTSWSQDRETLKTQLEYCKNDVAEVTQEKDICKSTNEALLQQINELKKKVVEYKEKVVEVNTELSKVQLQNQELKSVSDKLLKLGLKYKDDKDYDAAARIFNYIIAYYPETLDAEAARNQLKGLK